jgi:hypothetical protein
MQSMMVIKLRIQILMVMMLGIVLVAQGCAPPAVEGTGTVLATSMAGDIPTWTPRPQDLTQTALPTATGVAPVVEATSASQTPAAVAHIAATPKTVRVTIEGGNLFVHRGPSLDYNYIGVLYDGDTVLATGRDRVSRWIRVALPSNPEAEGWITTETNYTLIDGDIPNLPYVETEPARPAYIRNCTKHELWVFPAEIKLLDKFEAPYNEERFPVGIYQIYDVENQENKPIDEVNLSEGKRVDIMYDWEGEKSKCE